MPDSHGANFIRERAMAGFRDFLVRLALVLSVALPFYFLGAALATKFGMIDWRLGFGLLTFQFGPLVIMSAAAIAAIALLVALIVAPRRGRRIALAALALPVLALGYGAFAAQQARAVPPIHDISTDLVDIPTFSDTTQRMRAQVEGVNSLDLAAKTIPTTPAKRFGAMEGLKVTEVQAKAYPDIAPIKLAATPEQAYQRAQAAAVKLGWRLGYVSSDKQIFEASVQSQFYGFIDDIVVRIRPSGDGVVVDVRSVSRVGVSDLGANAKRIRAFRAALTGEKQ
jgi:uncharacterized protein (DUF1499 family)